jgi:hypothetical protein
VSGDVEAGEAWSLQEPDAVLRHGPLAVARPLPYRGAARRGPGSAPRLPRPEPVRGRAGRLGLTGVGVAHPNRSVDPCRARGGASSVPSTGCGTSGRSAAAEPEEHAWPASGSGRRTPRRPSCTTTTWAAGTPWSYCTGGRSTAGRGNRRCRCSSTQGIG